MGYRALPKQYLAAIEEETGSLHIDRLAQTGNSLSEQDLGELRALAAELCRARTPSYRPVACSAIKDESGSPHDHQHRSD